MKRRAFALVMLLVMLGGMLCACEDKTISTPPDEVAMKMANFKVIEDEEGLVYSRDTKVVYYMFSTYDTSGYAGFGYTYFAPYISENGRFCKYINDEIVEIIQESSNN